MRWDVRLTTKAAKQAKKYHEDILYVLQLLINDLQTKGPIPGKHWQNYSKLRTGKVHDRRHCHLIKGNPIYVCCWEVFKSDRYIEVYYVGTHEKAPY